MAMPLSALSSHISISTRLSVKTQCIPCFFRTLNTRGSASKQRSIYVRSGSIKIIDSVGEDSTCLPNQSDKNTDSLSAPGQRKREFPPGFSKDDIIDSIISSHQAEVADEKHIETLISEIKSMFGAMGDGETSPSAYDTAWVAKIPAVDGSEQPQFPETLEWILQSQLKDGSWGNDFYFLAFDRVLATLACIITLTVWRTGATQVQKGIEFFKKQARMMEYETDSPRPSRFELEFAAMLNEAKSLGLDLPYKLPFIKKIIDKREAKHKRPPRNSGLGENNQTSIQGWFIPQLACIYSCCIHAYREH